jgi:hypothetical protein
LAIAFFSIGFLDAATFLMETGFLEVEGAGFFATTLDLAAALVGATFLPRVFLTSFFFSGTGFFSSLATFLTYFSSALRSFF